jgi:hypothetical protein
MRKDDVGAFGLSQFVSNGNLVRAFEYFLLISYYFFIVSDYLSEFEYESDECFYFFFIREGLF